MEYHWGRERRRGSDRRVARDVPYAGPDRRIADRRRHPPEKKSRLGWIIVAALLFTTFDGMVWDGYYRRALIGAINADADTTRAWSDNVWHFS